MKTKIFFLATILFSLSGFTQILGPTAKEVSYRYVSAFQIPISASQKTDQDRAEFHASHLFGLFHSHKMVEKFGLNPDQIGGVGAPKSQMKIKIISSTKIDESLIQVVYENTGRMILHKAVAAELLKTKSLIVPMPVNPYLGYDQKCTDEHYNSFGDYWYFYDVFKSGCEYLSTEPYAVDTKIEISDVIVKKTNQTLSLPKLRGDNGNGDLFSIAFIQGFSDDVKATDDSGRANYTEISSYLLLQGFTVTKSKSRTKYPLNLYSKDVLLTNGQKIRIEIQHLLVETSIGSKSKVFANFFKDAVQNADVIVYAGHSGLGGNLDLPSLEAKVGKFMFNQKKKQIFYFDSCSSYSYYLDHFKVEKTKVNIDIMTNGLSSYFHTAQKTMAVLLGHLTTEKSEDVLWSSVLSEMEESLEGSTYFLNVGGI
jgi:hypothetical protein